MLYKELLSLLKKTPAFSGKMISFPNVQSKRAFRNHNQTDDKFINEYLIVSAQSSLTTINNMFWNADSSPVVSRNGHESRYIIYPCWNYGALPAVDPTCHYMAVCFFKEFQEIWLYDPRVPSGVKDSHRVWPLSMKLAATKIYTGRGWKCYALHGTQTTQDDCGLRVVELITEFLRDFPALDSRKMLILSFK